MRHIRKAAGCLVILSAYIGAYHVKGRQWHFEADAFVPTTKMEARKYAVTRFVFAPAHKIDSTLRENTGMIQMTGAWSTLSGVLGDIQTVEVDEGTVVFSGSHGGLPLEGTCELDFVHGHSSWVGEIDSSGRRILIELVPNKTSNTLLLVVDAARRDSVEERHTLHRNDG